ncbi:arginine--tRNA ligase [Candidatus Woesearchaeota archaeon]|nr:arginine--tRNA ligase [Candidatus Woesearchaeota archaeon]
MAEDSFKEEVVAILVKSISNKEFDKSKVSELIEVPQQEFGDYAFPCFVLARIYKKSPQEIANDLADKIKPGKKVTKVQATGPYLNFFVDKEEVAESTVADILNKKEAYGSSKNGKKTVMVEFFHANTHKAVHIGHIRNICLGESISRTLEFTGNKVVRVNYQGDIGPHVAKCLWGMINIKKFGKPPSANRLRWLADVYVNANKTIEGNEKLEAEVKQLLLKIYNKDKELNKLWNETRQWCLDEFEEMYKDFGVKYKELYFESGMEFPARDISKQLLKKGIAKESDGAVIIDLKSHKLGIFVLVTQDGTALYSSKDIALAQKKMSKYSLDKSIHVVGKEQELHFKQLFKTLEIMGGKEKEFAGKSYHLIYGLVMLPTGKMSSRSGSVVFYDELKDELLSLATAEVKKRHKDWNQKQVDETAKKIAFAALKLGMIYRDNEKQLVFDWEQAMNFEGETGPYIQYAHARICSILEKYGKKVATTADFSLLKEKEEQLLIRLLSQFPATVEAAASNYKPLLIARYLLDLSQAFNNFYHQHPILKAEEDVKKARLLLITAVKQVLKNGLNLLAIEAPEKM